MKTFHVGLGSTVRTALLCVLMCGGMPVGAAAHELLLQGSTAAGGSTTEIRGRVNGDLPFSVTGRFNDVLVVYDNTGWPVFVEDVRGLATKPYNRTRPAEKLASGETRVFLRAVDASVLLDGGWMEIWRSGSSTPLDQDRIVLVR